MWQTSTWSLTGTGQAFSTQGLIQLGGHIQLCGLRRFEENTAMFYLIFNCYADTYRLRRFEVLPCSTLFSNTIVRRRHINL